MLNRLALAMGLAVSGCHIDERIKQPEIEIPYQHYVGVNKVVSCIADSPEKWEFQNTEIIRGRVFRVMYKAKAQDDGAFALNVIQEQVDGGWIKHRTMLNIVLQDGSLIADRDMDGWLDFAFLGGKIHKITPELQGLYNKWVATNLDWCEAA